MDFLANHQNANLIAKKSGPEILNGVTKLKSSIRFSQELILTMIFSKKNLLYAVISQLEWKK